MTTPQDLVKDWLANADQLTGATGYYNAGARDAYLACARRLQQILDQPDTDTHHPITIERPGLVGRWEPRLLTNSRDEAQTLAAQLTNAGSTVVIDLRGDDYLVLVQISPETHP